MISPNKLKPGSRIGIVSTARSISAEEIQPALKIIENWGFTPVLGKNLFKAHHQFAGTDEERLEDLQQFLDDEHIDAILCARGGYGTVRIIDQADFSSFVKNPKWVGGYSDVTVLLNKINLLGIESLHCSMPINFQSNSKAALESIKTALTGGVLHYEFESHKFNNRGSAEGILTGGNLSILYSQLGSQTALNTDKSILFLEDLDEYLYHIDRMMYNLQRNDYLNDVAAVLVGGMSDMNDNSIPFGYSSEEIIHEHLKGRHYPRAYNFKAGHMEENHCLIFGRNARLESGVSCKLEFDESQ